MSSPRSRFATTALSLALTGGLALGAEPPREVVVLNLPSVQEVKGRVSVKDLPVTSRFFAKEAIIVPPVGRDETAHLLQAGILDAEGFASASISLHVESQGKVTREGKLGVLLIPDRKPIRRSLNLEDRILLSTELQVDLPIGSIPVASQKPFRITFPRYRIYLYNESNSTAQADLYIYLTR